MEGSVIEVVVEFRAKPGRRGELEQLLERIVSEQGPDVPGFLGSTRYEVVDDPDAVLEIARWESVESRAAHIEESATTGAYAPLVDLLAIPARATVIRRLG
jgi:quinol monooxygenase YgiN